MSRRKKLFVVFVSVAGGIAFGLMSSVALGWLYQVAYQLFEDRAPADAPRLSTPFNTAAYVVLGLMVGAGVARVFVWLKERTGEWWERMDSGDRFSLFIGVFIGLFASMPFLFLLNSLELGVYVPLAIVGLLLGFSTLSVYALRSMEDILPWHKGKGRSRRSDLKILDTNVLIDGRLYDLARTGFLEAPLYVPGFVLEELQYIADSHDLLRRQRGRRGLDILRHLQADFNTELRTQDKAAPDLGDGVDARLVRLARALGGDIVTNDLNLNRVASLQDVRVLNINDLALAMRTNVLPQENLALSVIREGSQPGQGVGYLDDGTMVVVENGRDHIGETLDVVVTQVIQTERGKMIFAEVPDTNGTTAKRSRASAT